MTFYKENEDVLVFTISIGGILLAFIFAALLNYRHKICFDYESKRDVAINILRDKFVQEIAKYISRINQQTQNGDVEISEIYKQPGQIKSIKDLSAYGEDMSKVNRDFRYLERSNKWSWYLLWISFLLAMCPALNIWTEITTEWVSKVWLFLFLLMLGAGVVTLSVTMFLDGRFLTRANSIVEPDLD